MNLQQVRKLARMWQKDLGLTNWKIKVEWASKEDMAEEDFFGLNLYDPPTMTSTIKIRKNQTDAELKETVVHELLHLLMFPLESAAGYSIKSPTDQWETAMEQTINKLSELLVNGRQAADCSCIRGVGVSERNEAESR